jgi:rhamnulokinase
MAKQYSNNPQYVSIDLGATSGRILVSEVLEQNQIKMIETHRFLQQTKNINGYEFWNFDFMLDEIEKGLLKTLKNYPHVVSIGIDSWGVDYGLIGHDGSILRTPISYRDKRTFDVLESFNQMIAPQTLYELTGIQHLPFNSIYQLYEDYKNQNHFLEQTKYILLIPDLIAYILTNQARTELTNLSTTALYNPNKKDLISIINQIGIKKSQFPKLIQPGEVYGNLTTSWKNKLNIKQNIKVVAVCSHDTASAFVTTPKLSNQAFLNSGTWSLIGQNIDQPIINEQSYVMNFSNEVGYGHQIRFLKNVTGFYLINKLMESFNLQNNDVKAYQDALKETDYFGLIDVDHEAIIKSQNITQTIHQLLTESHQKVPINQGQYFRLIYQSIAYKISQVLNQLSTLRNAKITHLMMVGGGSELPLFIEMVEKLSHVKIIIGHKEMTAYGNALILWLENKAVSSIQEGIKLILDDVKQQTIEHELLDKNWVTQVKKAGAML